MHIYVVFLCLLHFFSKQSIYEHGSEYHDLGMYICTHIYERERERDLVYAYMLMHAYTWCSIGNGRCQLYLYVYGIHE